MADAFINSPVDLAGRLRITTFGPYVSNLGYDPAPRETDTTAIYCDGPEVAAERMAMYDATYVLSSGGVPCSAGSRHRLLVESALRDALRRRWGHGLAAQGLVNPGRRRARDQPLGSTIIVTSGVIPVKTLIATL